MNTEKLMKIHQKMMDRCIETRNEIEAILGVSPDKEQSEDALDLLIGFAMQETGRGLADGVMARVRARRGGAA